jgi:glucose-1-phosphate thymidylyltransferase
MSGYRKGIILAGGSGSRLHPMTNVVNKQLLPVYDKPMIYYPLSTLMSAAIKDILIISSPDQLKSFVQLLGAGDRWGLNITYAAQDQPRGLADAFLIAENVGFLQDEPSALALGDNIFYGEDFYRDLMYITKMNTNWVFGYRVSNPGDYGVVDFKERDDRYSGKVIVNSIEEKPDEPKSNYAVPGLYFYDNTAVERARALKPSHRGELEITDLNNSYIEDRKLNVKLLRDNAAWFDTGNADAMFEAAMFIKSIQSRTGQLIGCIEEVAYKMLCINEEEFYSLIREMPSCQYKRYLRDKYQVSQYT